MADAEGAIRTRFFYDLVSYFAALPVVKTVERALEDLREGKPTPKGEGVSLNSYEKIVSLDQWATIEKRFSQEERF